MWRRVMRRLIRVCAINHMLSILLETMVNTKLYMNQDLFYFIIDAKPLIG